jgi:hypothetical protein
LDGENKDRFNRLSLKLDIYVSNDDEDVDDVYVIHDDEDDDDIDDYDC